MSKRSRAEPWFRDVGDPKGARARAAAAEAEQQEQIRASMRNCDPWRGVIGMWVRPGFGGFLGMDQTT